MAQFHSVDPSPLSLFEWPPQPQDLPDAPAKAISLHQPWASLIVMGHKCFETRSWSTNYRGKLVICAAKKKTKALELSYHSLANIFNINLLKYSWNKLSFGMAIAVCDLTDCISMTDDFIEKQSKSELACGHWETGRYTWKLEDIKPLIPTPITGKQGLWNVNLKDFCLAFPSEKSW